MIVDDSASSKAEWLQSVFRQFEGPLVRYAARITGDLESARDVVQETFFRLCQAERSRVENGLAQWLFTVCRNRALDVQRKENRMVRLEEMTLEACESPGPGPADAVERREQTQDVLRLLATLPGNQQEVVRLKFQNGLSYREISQITNLTVTNVGFLLHTALKTVRQRLKAESRPAHNLNPLGEALYEPES